MTQLGELCLTSSTLHWEAFATSQALILLRQPRPGKNLPGSPSPSLPKPSLLPPPPSLLPPSPSLLPPPPSLLPPSPSLLPPPPSHSQPPGGLNSPPPKNQERLNTWKKACLGTSVLWNLTCLIGCQDQRVHPDSPNLPRTRITRSAC